MCKRSIIPLTSQAFVSYLVITSNIQSTPHRFCPSSEDQTQRNSRYTSLFSNYQTQFFFQIIKKAFIKVVVMVEGVLVMETGERVVVMLLEE